MNATTDMTKPEYDKYLEQILAKAGVPFKKVWANGCSIIITCYSAEAASKVAGLLAATKELTVRGPVQSIDYNHKNHGTNLNKSTHNVWRVGAVRI